MPGAGFSVGCLRCVQPALPRILGTSTASGKEQVAEVGKGVAQSQFDDAWWFLHA